MMGRIFIKTDENYLLSIDKIVTISYENIEDLKLDIFDIHGDCYTVTGPFAVEVIMLFDPSVLEGKRMKWLKNQWMVHNLIGHPLMQLASYFKKYKLGMWFHDITIPKPLSKKSHE